MTSQTFFLIFIPILVIILLAVNLLLATHNPYQEKNSAFECGFHSFLGQNRSEFSISFFIFALLFLLFDLEILLVYPFIVSFYVNEQYGLAIMLIFFILLTLGFVFELGKNALSIDSRQVKTGQKLIDGKDTRVSLVVSDEYILIKGLLFDLIAYILSEKFIYFLLQLWFILILCYIFNIHTPFFPRVVFAMGSEQPDSNEPKRDKGKGRATEQPFTRESSEEGSSEDSVYSSEFHSDDSKHTETKKFIIKKVEGLMWLEKLIALFSEKPSQEMANKINKGIRSQGYHFDKYKRFIKLNNDYRNLTQEAKGKLIGEDLAKRNQDLAHLFRELISKYPYSLRDFRDDYETSSKKREHQDDSDNAEGSSGTRKKR